MKLRLNAGESEIGIVRWNPVFWADGYVWLTSGTGRRERRPPCRLKNHSRRISCGAAEPEAGSARGKALRL